MIGVRRKNLRGTRSQRKMKRRTYQVEDAINLFEGWNTCLFKNKNLKDDHLRWAIRTIEYFGGRRKKIGRRVLPKKKRILHKRVKMVLRSLQELNRRWFVS
jgi:hypothetical protein